MALVAPVFFAGTFGNFVPTAAPLPCVVGKEGGQAIRKLVIGPE